MFKDPLLFPFSRNETVFCFFLIYVFLKCSIKTICAQMWVFCFFFKLLTFSSQHFASSPFLFLDRQLREGSRGAFVTCQSELEGNISGATAGQAWRVRDGAARLTPTLTPVPARLVPHPETGGSLQTTFHRPLNGGKN